MSLISYASYRPNKPVRFGSQSTGNLDFPDSTFGKADPIKLTQFLDQVRQAGQPIKLALYQNDDGTLFVSQSNATRTKARPSIDKILGDLSFDNSKGFWVFAPNQLAQHTSTIGWYGKKKPIINVAMDILSEVVRANASMDDPPFKYVFPRGESVILGSNAFGIKFP